MGHKPKKFTLEGKAVYDEKTGQLVYKASLFEWVSGILVCLFILGSASYWVLSGSFGASGPTRTAWGYTIGASK